MNPTPTLPPPPWQSAPMQNGVFTQPWLAWFNLVYASLGGSSGSTPASAEAAAWANTQSVDVDGIESRIDGAYATAIAQNVQPAGLDREVQFNNGGEFGASSNLKFEQDVNSNLKIGTATLRSWDQDLGAGFSILGHDRDTFTRADFVKIKSGDTVTGSLSSSIVSSGAEITNSASDITVGGDLSLTAGSLEGAGLAGFAIPPGEPEIVISGSVNISGGSAFAGDDYGYVGNGGNVNITAGRGKLGGGVSIEGGDGYTPPGEDPDISHKGGDVYISSGYQDAQELRGSIKLQVAYSNALTINAFKGWGLGSAVDYGRDGKILTGHSDTASPTWESKGTIEVRFDYGDATPKDIFLLEAGKTVLSTSIVILVPFDDPTAVLTFGDATDPARLIAASDNVPSSVGTYATVPGIQYVNETMLTLSIAPGVSTQGSGLVVIEYQS